MKVLTIIGTIFIPLTFLAGVYGLNMPIPENRPPLAYPVSCRHGHPGRPT